MLTQVLVVAHDRPTGAALTSMLGRLGVGNVIDAAGPEHAMTALEHGVDAAFLFASVPDGLALRIARSAVRACPMPSVFVLSNGPHPDLFALAKAGATAHLTWPLSPEQLLQCLEATPLATDRLEVDVRSLVGRVGIKDAQGWVRRTMLEQALDASHGSRRAAARLLGVTRPAIQRMLREEGGSLIQVSDSSKSVYPVVSRSTLRPIPTIVSTAASRAKAHGRRSY